MELSQERENQPKFFIPPPALPPTSSPVFIR
jgi:hypothetical protein